MSDKPSDKYEFYSLFKQDKNENTTINGYDRTYLINNKIPSKTYYELAKPPLKIKNPSLISITQSQISSLFSETFTCPICKLRLSKPLITKHCSHIACESCYPSLLASTKSSCASCMQSSKKPTKDYNTLLDSIINLLSPFNNADIEENDFQINEPITIKEEIMCNNSNSNDEFIGVKRRRMLHIMREAPSYKVNEYVVPISNAADEYNKDNMEFVILHKKDGGDMEGMLSDNKCAYSVLLPKHATLAIIAKYIAHKYKCYGLKDEIVICVMDEDNNSIYVTDSKITLSELRRTYPVKHDIHLSFEFLREI